MLGCAVGKVSAERILGAIYLPQRCTRLLAASRNSEELKRLAEVNHPWKPNRTDTCRPNSSHVEQSAYRRWSRGAAAVLIPGWGNLVCGQMEVADARVLLANHRGLKQRIQKRP